MFLRCFYAFNAICTPSARTYVLNSRFCARALKILLIIALNGRNVEPII